MHFCGDERATVTASVKAAEGAAFKQTKVMTKLGELWRALDSATVDSYKARAAADKERYDAALAAAGILTPKQKKASKPKRPLSAYMLFCQERRPALTETLKASLGPGFKYTVVMTKLGEEWRELSDGAKVKYQDMAAAENVAADKAKVATPPQASGGALEERLTTEATPATPAGSPFGRGSQRGASHDGGEAARLWEALDVV